MSCACGRGTPGWKPDPGVCPRDDDHGPANGHCACIHEPDGGIEPRVTAPDARQSDELRDRLGATFGHKPSPVHSQHGDTGRVCCGVCFVDWPCATVRKIERVMVPVVTAWHEKAAEAQARARAAEVITRVKAVPTYTLTNDDQPLGTVVLADDVLAALAADDRTDPA